MGNCEYSKHDINWLESENMSEVGQVNHFMGNESITAIITTIISFGKKYS